MLAVFFYLIGGIYLLSWGVMLAWAIKRTLSGAGRRAEQAYEKERIQRQLSGRIGVGERG